MKNRQSIETYLRNHREEFNTDRPPQDHLKRFEQKLKLKKQKINEQLIYTVLKIAAIVILIFTASVFYAGYSLLHPNDYLSEVSKEYDEVEHYYQMEVREDLLELLQWDHPASLKRKIVTLWDIYEINKSNMQIMHELTLNPGDQRLINALQKNYNLKLLILENTNNLYLVQQKQISNKHK
jgi:hypothetical protein